jgi:hypothetical protein
MAAGLRYCDRALTVSPSYAVECCTDPEKGGLVEDQERKFQKWLKNANQDSFCWKMIKFIIVFVV